MIAGNIIALLRLEECMVLAFRRILEAFEMAETAVQIQMEDMSCLLYCNVKLQSLGVS